MNDKVLVVDETHLVIDVVDDVLVIVGVIINENCVSEVVDIFDDDGVLVINVFIVDFVDCEV
jgi:hypothetical protein